MHLISNKVWISKYCCNYGQAQTDPCLYEAFMNIHTHKHIFEELMVWVSHHLFTFLTSVCSHLLTAEQTTEFSVVQHCNVRLFSLLFLTLWKHTPCIEHQHIVNVFKRCTLMQPVSLSSVREYHWNAFSCWNSHT